MKTRFGHTEGTAGIQGVMGALEELENSAIIPIVHLRNLNPLVQSAFHDWSSRHCVQCLASRCMAPLLSKSTLRLAGCSSFGMTGTNAHGMVSAIEGSYPSLPTLEELVWHPKRLWPIPMLSKMLYYHEIVQANAVFHCSLPLETQNLAFLLDHRIQETSIMPGAGMIEASLSGCLSLMGHWKMDRLFSIRQASITSPIVIDTSGRIVKLECQLDCHSGNLKLLQNHIGGGKTISFQAAISQTDSQNCIPIELSSDQILNKLFDFIKYYRHENKRRCFGFIKNRDQMSGQFLAHPALLDNVLQLGPATNRANDNSGSTRVIAGFDCTVLSSTSFKTTESYIPTTVELNTVVENGSVLSQHNLYGRPEEIRVASIANVQAKVIKLNANNNGGSKKLVYFVDWQCETPKKQSYEKIQTWPYPNYVVNTRPSKSVRYFLATGTNDGALFAEQACATSVMLIQSISRSLSKSTIDLYSQDMRPYTWLTSGNTLETAMPEVGSSISALLRVAMKEFPNFKWSSHSKFSNLPSHFPHDFNKETFISDVSGTILGPSVSLAPILLSENDFSDGTTKRNCTSFHGALIVTGGMGALGLLMASWLAATQNVDLLLLGRTGRASSQQFPSDSLMRSNIFGVRADVSSLEEVVDVFRRPNMCNTSPVRGIMHAGAVLDSKILPKVAYSGIRAEHSGKT